VKYHSDIHLKNEGQEGPVWVVVGIPVGGERVNRDGEGGEGFVYVYKNRSMKPIEIVL
jgi:hypothetical protein